MASATTHETRGVLLQIVVRALLPMIVLGITIWMAVRDFTSAHEIGSHAVVFDSRAKGFVVTEGDGHRIRVIDFGLEEGRGLAFRQLKSGDHLYIADAWDALFDCQLDRSNSVPRCHASNSEPGLRRLPPTEVCPFGECVAVEHGGIALTGTDLYVSDAHQRRISKRSFTGSGFATFGDRMFGRIHDIALFKPDGLIVAAGPLDNGMEDTPDGDSESSSEAKARDSGNGSDRDSSTAAVYELTDRGTTPLDAEFTHPVGVAYSPGVPTSPRERLYVVDINGRSESWRFFERNTDSDKWQEKGVLWTQDIPDPKSWPRLQSMVVAIGTQNDEALFAAGPDGLYLLHSDGTLLAKYVLGTPVSGLAWGGPIGTGRELFMTVGRKLCVLRTKAAPLEPRPGGS